MMSLTERTKEVAQRTNFMKHLANLHVFVVCETVVEAEAVGREYMSCLYSGWMDGDIYDAYTKIKDYPEEYVIIIKPGKDTMDEFGIETLEMLEGENVIFFNQLTLVEQLYYIMNELNL